MPRSGTEERQIKPNPSVLRKRIPTIPRAFSSGVHSSGEADSDTRPVTCYHFYPKSLPKVRSPLSYAQSPRPVIVLIHGRDQGKRKEADVRKEFLDGFFAGLERASLQNIVGTGDVKFVWYGDIYADDGVDRTCPFVQTVPPAEQNARQSLSDAVRRFLVSASSVPGLERSLSDLLIHDTDEYLGKANFRCATDKRLASILNDAHARRQPVIIAAHSMGSLVTFSVLRRLDVDGQINVAHLVTMGSQLGMNEVLRALEGSHASIPVKVPISIQRWTNLVAKGDLLALKQSGFFDAIGPQRKPADKEVDNGNQHPHDAASYLQQRLAATTIAKAFCDSFPGAARPSGCSALRWEHYCRARDGGGPT